MGAGLLAVKSGFIVFIKSCQFPLQINTLERERYLARVLPTFAVSCAENAARRKWKSPLFGCAS